MTAIRLWMLGAIVITMAIVAGGWFLIIQPQLDQTALADQSRADVAVQNDGYLAELARLKEDFAGIAAKKDELAALRTSIPVGSADGAFLAELEAVAAETGVTITNVSVSEAKPFAPVVPDQAAVATPAPTEGEATADAAAPQVALDTAPAGTTTPTIPGAEFVTATNFTAIPYDISVDGELSQTVAFVAAIQKGSRTFLVSKLTFAPGSQSGGFSADISGLTWAFSSAASAPATPTDPLVTATTTAN